MQFSLYPYTIDLATSADMIIAIFLLVSTGNIVLLIAILRYVRRSAQMQGIALNSATLQEQERQGREYLGNILEMDPASLPPLGGWAASADFLIILAEHIMTTRPKIVVEFGAGVSSLVILRCLQLNGVGELYSYDHDNVFAKITEERIRRVGLNHNIKVSDLKPANDYKGIWYLADVPDNIDLMVVDGPPAALHPEARGGAGSLFHKLNPGGTVLLDDANRPGEKAIVKSWKEKFSGMSFSHIGTSKGTVLAAKPVNKA